MRLSPATLAFVVLLYSIVVAGQPVPGEARGQVTDSSGGVLPGVTVAASSGDGRIVATAVTDGSGGFVLRTLPAGSVVLTFQLEGFASATVAVTVQPGAASRVVQSLELAHLSETVVVRGPAPVAPPPPRVSLPLPPPPPPPVVRPVPAHDRDSICGPAKPGAMRESLGTVRSGRYKSQGEMYTTGAEVVIDGGRRDGLEVGLNLVVRHHYVARWAADPDTIGEHSAGLLQIVTAGDSSSTAVVVYSCDEFKNGDFLASFKPEPARDPDPVGTPAFLNPARILFADEGQTLGAPGRLMVIDRGSNDGTHVGQRFTLFRRRRDTAKPDVVGEAIVVAVRTDSATIRVGRVTDGISAGDLAAPHTPSLSAR